MHVHVHHSSASRDVAELLSPAVDGSKMTSLAVNGEGRTARRTQAMDLE